MSAEAPLTTVHVDRWRTRLALVVRSPETVHPRPLQAALVSEVDRLELLASRFRDDSEISDVNRNAGHWCDTSWDFVEVLSASLDAAGTTDGLVSPLVGSHVDSAGYRTWRDGTPPADPVDTGVVPDWRDIAISPAGGHARVRIPAGSQLDLGAVAKGWLADRLAGLVQRICRVDVIADMGGDLSIRTTSQPWVVAVEPGAHGETQNLYVEQAGLATSGTTHRRWRTTTGGTAHHIIDPRTGRPAESVWSSASVLAADAAAANTAATAAIVLGDEAPTWLARQGLDALLSGPDGQQLVGRWPIPGTDDNQEVAA